MVHIQSKLVAVVGVHVPMGSLSLSINKTHQGNMWILQLCIKKKGSKLRKLEGNSLALVQVENIDRKDGVKINI